MKRKNFPGRKRQRRIDALWRQHDSLVLKMESVINDDAAFNQVNDELCQIEDALREMGAMEVSHA